jgi:hypothetical protein
MVCYQVLARFAFSQHKAVLVSTHIKKQKARAFLLKSRLPFGSPLKYTAFSKQKKKRPGMSRIFTRSIKTALFQTPPPFPAVSLRYFRRFKHERSNSIQSIQKFLPRHGAGGTQNQPGIPQRQSRQESPVRLSQFQ